MNIQKELDAEDAEDADAPLFDTRPFHFEVDFSRPGELELQIPEGTEFDIAIYWGDGSDLVRISSDDDRATRLAALTHRYERDDVSWTFGLSRYEVLINGTLPTMTFGGDQHLVAVHDFGELGWESTAEMFAHCRKLRWVGGAGDLSGVTDMSGMFRGAWKVNVDTAEWDVSNVTTMRRMFNGTRDAKPDTSSWDVSNVLDMSEMFFHALSAKPETGAWDVSNVLFMQGMFRDAFKADPDTSQWDVSNVRDMEYMFSGAKRANPDTSGWKVPPSTGVRNMFTGAKKAAPDASVFSAGDVELGLVVPTFAAHR